MTFYKPTGYVIYVFTKNITKIKIINVLTKKNLNLLHSIVFYFGWKIYIYLHI